MLPVPEAAVAEAGFLLLLGHGVEIQTEFRQRLAHRLDDPEVEEVVHQMRAGQELRREIRHDPGGRAGQFAHRLHASVEDAVANREGERDVVVMPRRQRQAAAEGAHEVVDERLLQIRHGHAVTDVGHGRGSG